MAYIICEPCVGTKDTACVEPCPVDCIHPTKEEAEYESAEMLYIHPDECIDCEACVPECPIEAIYSDQEVPERWQSDIELNAQKAPELQVITEKHAAPLADSTGKECKKASEYDD